jgi:hypothetical protein
MGGTINNLELRDKRKMNLAPLLLFERQRAASDPDDEKSTGLRIGVGVE